MSTLRTPSPIDPMTDLNRRYPIEQGGRVLSMSYEQALHSHRTMGAGVATARNKYNEQAAEWGWLLIQMKRELGHGNFTPFLNRGQVNIRTAQRAMALAEACVHAGRFDVQSVDGVLKARAAKRRDAETNPNTTPRKASCVSHLAGTAGAGAPAIKLSGFDELKAEADAPYVPDPNVPELSDEDVERWEAQQRREEMEEFLELEGDEGGEAECEVESAESEDGDGEDAAHESDGHAAAGLSGLHIGAATTTGLETSSDADDAGPPRRDAGGSGVVGFIGKGLGAGEQGLEKQESQGKETQLGLDGIYAEAARVRDVAGRMERGELSDAMRKRLMLLVAEIDGGNAT